MSPEPTIFVYFAIFNAIFATVQKKGTNMRLDNFSCYLTVIALGNKEVKMELLSL